MLRVLVLVDHARGISGPHRNVVGSLNALSAREDVQVRLLCGEIDESEPYARCKRVDVRLGYDPHDAKKLPVNLWRVVSAARGCDVIYVPSGGKSLLYAQFARLGRRLVVGPNITPLFYRFAADDSPRGVEVKLLSDCWIEASYARREHVARCTGNAEIKVVHHAIDGEKWGPQRRDPAIWKRLGVPDHGLKVLCVSADDRPLKGVTQLLDGYRLITRRSQQPTTLVLAGRRSQPVCERLNSIDSAYDVGFVGADLLPVLYASADISVIPSSWDNFPFSVLESLASGVATIATKTGGIPEQIVDGTSGRLINISDDGVTHRPDAPERIAAAVLELIENPPLRARLAHDGRQRALEHFSEDRLGRDLMTLLQG